MRVAADRAVRVDRAAVSAGDEVLCIGEVDAVAMPPERLSGRSTSASDGPARVNDPHRGEKTMHRIRQPRVAEIVASRLRDDILSGRLKRG